MADHPGPTSLEITRTLFNGGVVLKLRGRVDDTFKPDDLATGVQGVLLIDLDGISHVTSFGVRNWVECLRAIRCSYLGFLRCRPSVVAHFNSVAEFAGAGELISFYAPYICASCGKAQEVLIDRRLLHEEVARHELPELACIACKGPCALDDDPQNYLYYAANAPEPNPPPVVKAVLDSGKEQLRTTKLVEGRVTGLWLAGELSRPTQIHRLMEGMEGELVIIADGLKPLSSAAHEALQGTLSRQDVKVQLARIPVAVALALHKSPAGFGAANVVSALVPGKCERCSKTTRVEVSYEEAVKKSFQGTCADCRNPAIVQLDEPTWLSLQALPWSVPSAEVTDFLAKHVLAPSFSPASTRAPTQVDTEKFELEQSIGMGGMAEVFLARQRGVGGFEKRVVVKRIIPELAANQDFLEMFLSEARLAALINHPNVAQIYDIVVSEKQGYLIAMEHVDGLDLDRALVVSRRLMRRVPLEVALRIVRDVCAGLHAAHSAKGPDGKEAPIIHRDVSPHNVLLSLDGQVKLSDFGVAKAANATTTANVSEGVLYAGKPSYAAPEQISGRVSASVQTDVFAAGILLYLTLSLTHPFRREHAFGTAQAILQGQYQPVSIHREDLPHAVVEIVDVALAPKPEGRFATADQMRAQLERVLASLEQRVGRADVGGWLKGLLQDGAEFVPSARVPNKQTVSGDETTRVTPVVPVLGIRK